MKELLSAASAVFVVGTADSPNVNAWLTLAVVLAIINLAAWHWETINRTIERGVIWIMAAGARGMIFSREPGISTREVADIIRDYAKEKDSR